MSPVLTSLPLTAAGSRVDRQSWHEMLVSVTTPPEPGRVLWSWPARDLILVQAGNPVTANLLPGLVTAARSADIRTHWPAGTPVDVSMIGNPIRNRGGNRPRDGETRRQRGTKTALPVDQHATWLATRLGEAIAVDQVATEPLRPAIARKRDHKVTIALAGFYASGVVTDPRRLADMICHGLGSGRAYGAGMLLVAEAAR